MSTEVRIDPGANREIDLSDRVLIIERDSHGTRREYSRTVREFIDDDTRFRSDGAEGTGLDGTTYVLDQCSRPQDRLQLLEEGGSENQREIYVPSRDVLALAHKASEMMFQNSDTSFSELSEGIEFVDENADGVVDPSDHVRRFGVIEAISVHDFLRAPSFPMGRFSHLSSRERLNILERGGSRFFDESYQASPEVLRIAADSQNASHRVFPVSPRRNWTRYC